MAAGCCHRAHFYKSSLIAAFVLTFLFSFPAQAQFSGADSLCGEPGEATISLPAPTSTPTPTATITPTPIDTSPPQDREVIQPSPTPAPSQRGIISGTVRDQTGRAVANAIVYIFDLGTTVTDANGNFSKVGADPNKDYAVAIQSDGFEGPIPPVTLRAGGGSTLTVVSTTPQDFGGCKLVSVKKTLASNADRVSKIFDRLTRDYDRWGEVWPADIETVVQEGMIRARHQLNQYLAASLGIPTTIRTCSGVAAEQCTKFSIGEARRKMIRTARWMRQEALLINRALRLRRGRPNSVSKQNERRLRQLSDTLAQSIAAIPSKSYRCQ